MCNSIQRVGPGVIILVICTFVIQATKVPLYFFSEGGEGLAYFMGYAQGAHNLAE